MSSDRITHADFLGRLAALRTDDDVVVATMTAGMMWPRHSKHEMDICSMAPMGAASPMGLGIALGRPDLGVIVIDGDGSLLMNLGALVTIGGKRPPRFLHIVLENEAYDITGGQGLPGSGTTHVPEFAKSVGYTVAVRATDDASLEWAVSQMHAGAGPVLLAVPVSRDFDFADLRGYTGSEKALRSIGRAGYENLAKQIRSRPRSQVSSRG